MTALLDRFRRKPRMGAANAAAPKAATAPEAKKPAAAPAVKQVKGDTKEAYRVLLNPVLSEKAARIADDRQYVFVVATDATKIGVARAIAAVYGVRPAKVQMLRVKGKRVRFGRTVGREKDWKKAIVTLKTGDRIAVVEGV